MRTICKKCRKPMVPWEGVAFCPDCAEGMGAPIDIERDLVDLIRTRGIARRLLDGDPIGDDDRITPEEEQ